MIRFEILLPLFYKALCRVAATAFPTLLKHFRNGTQRFVYLFCGSKVARHIWFEDDDVSTLRIFSGVLAPDALAEVVFRTQGVVIFRPSSSSLFLHSSSVPRAWRVGR